MSSPGRPRTQRTARTDGQDRRLGSVGDGTALSMSGKSGRKCGGTGGTSVVILYFPAARLPRTGLRWERRKFFCESRRQRSDAEPCGGGGCEPAPARAASHASAPEEPWQPEVFSHPACNISGACASYSVRSQQVAQSLGARWGGGGKGDAPDGARLSVEECDAHAAGCSGCEAGEAEAAAHVAHCGRQQPSAGAMSA